MRYCFFLGMSVDGLIHYGLVAWFPLPQMTIYSPDCAETAMYYLDLKVMEMFSELLGKDSVHYKTLSAKAKNVFK